MPLTAKHGGAKFSGATRLDHRRVASLTPVYVRPWALPHIREVSMTRLVTRGRFTHAYVKGLLDAPEDREAAVRKVVEAAGGKVISFYVTTGESDFLLISEADESEAIIASLMTAAAAGTISDVSTGRAWTGAEFKAIMERASKAASAYRPPGKR